jgi:tight adherence protein C
VTDSQLVFLALVFFVVVGGVYGAATILRPNPAQRRLRELTPTSEISDRPSSARWVKWVAEITSPVGHLAAPEEGFERSNVRLRFVHAGIRNATAPVAFFGIKTVLTLGLPVVTTVALALSGSHTTGNGLLTLALLSAAIGYYAPNIWLARRVAARQREILDSFPDALDLMTVCVEAGLGTESALTRVAEDIQLKSRTLAEELRLVNLELRAGADRERALRNLAIRTGVDEVDGFVTMISQAERFGTSIAASLRVHSDMLRTRRRQRAEETAAKISLKLLFPLIFCIFPSLMVVLMGPAMIQIYRVMLTAMGANH